VNFNPRLGGIPQILPSAEKAAALRDRSILLTVAAMAAGLPKMAGDAARSAAHWAVYERAFNPSYEDLEKLKTHSAAMTLPLVDEAGFEVL